MTTNSKEPVVSWLGKKGSIFGVTAKGEIVCKYSSDDEFWRCTDQVADYVSPCAKKLLELNNQRNAALAAQETAERERDDLRKLVAGYEAWERSVNEALNSGDGSYHP